MRLESMQDVFVEQLRDVLSAEKQLTKALPKMAKAARSPRLKAAFDSHLRETEEHIDRLERVFGTVGKKPVSKHCAGMEGLVKEGEEAMEAEGEDALVDSVLIAAAQRVEHYEISAYGSLAEYARVLGLEEANGLLEETLAEEKAADAKLTEVNESEIEESALAVGMEGTGPGTSGTSRSGSSRSGSSGSGSSGSGSSGGGRSRSTTGKSSRSREERSGL
ncbi:MAG TPA: ferritin-like domain-containing protein [Gemmatimonadaceae bacterium]|jgi:ferritin-like metal-binding protein YciE|nr:ferritin-like domain-containing protein [Gemmatimonadaceae bacterium]